MEDVQMHCGGENLIQIEQGPICEKKLGVRFGQNLCLSDNIIVKKNS